MSEQERCPGCGEKVSEVGYWLGPIMSHEPDSLTCLRNQLAQRDARTAELVAENERLRTLLAAYRKGEVPTEDVVAAFGDMSQEVRMATLCPVCGGQIVEVLEGMPFCTLCTARKLEQKHDP